MSEADITSANLATGNPPTGDSTPEPDGPNFVPNIGPDVQGQQPSESTTRTSGKGRWVVIGIFLAFIGMLAIGLMREKLFGQRVAGNVPDFEFVTFEGETIRLEDLRGKGVVVNFWASWCDPCRAEADLLESTWRREKPKDEIIFLGVDYLDQEHSALAYLDEFSVTYPNGPDLQSAIARRFRIKGVPETFFIRPDGTIESTIVGPVLSEADFEQRLDAIRPQN